MLKTSNDDIDNQAPQNRKDEERKHTFRALTIFLLMIVFFIDVPYKGMPLLDYLLPTITLKSFSINIATVLILISMVLFFRELVALNKLKAHRGLVFVVVLFMMLPLAESVSEWVLAPFYYLNSGAKTIELLECNSTTSQNGMDQTINFDIKLRNHRSLKENTIAEIEFLNAEELGYQVIDTNYTHNIYNKHGELNMSLSYRVKSKEGNDVLLTYGELKDLEYQLVFKDDNTHQSWGPYKLYRDMRVNAMIEFY